MSNNSNGVDREEEKVSGNETNKPKKQVAKKITFKLTKAKTIEKSRLRRKAILFEKELEVYDFSVVYVQGRVKWKSSKRRTVDGVKKKKVDGELAVLTLDRYYDDDETKWETPTGSIILGKFRPTENASDVLPIEWYQNSLNLSENKWFWGPHSVTRAFVLSFSFLSGVKDGQTFTFEDLDIEVGVAHIAQVQRLVRVVNPPVTTATAAIHNRMSHRPTSN